LKVVLALRHKLYDWKILPSSTGSRPAIVIGNVAIGGQGKTPFTLFLLRTWPKIYPKPAFLSRGYGRKTKGFFWIKAQTTSTVSAGDEPVMVATTFPEIHAAVGENRLEAMKKMSKEHQEISCFLLDDAFQHRSLIPHTSIVLSRYDSPFFNDFIWPKGRLRDLPSSVGKANAVVFTYCPSTLSELEKQKMRDATLTFTSAAVFFAETNYLQPHAVFNHQPLPASEITGFSCISGIANPHALSKSFYRQ
jgi:tetraacyldisaccharide 4'-kinase